MLLEDGRPASAVRVTAGRPWWTVIVGCLGVALVVGSMVAFNTALADIAVSTSATQRQLNWIVDGYTLALACLLLPAGAIGDRYGRRASLIAGLALFGVACAASAMLTDPVHLIATRMAAGVGAAFVMPATLSLLSLAYPRGQRMRVIGIWAGVAGCAGIVGMVGSGVVLAFSDWRAICWALAGAAALVLALTFTVPAAPDRDAPAVDWLGALLITTAIAVVVFGLLEAPHRGWTDSLTIGCLIAGLLAGAAFVLVEQRRRSPLVDVTLFRDRRFAAGVATIAVLFAATFGFFYLGMQYVQLIMGYSPLLTAVAFAPFAVPLVALSALSFRYAPRFGLRRTLSAGLILIAGGFVSMIVLHQDSSYTVVIPPLIVIGAGIGLCTTPATSAIMGAVGDERQGIGSAINDVAREFGAAVGMAVVGSVLADRYTASAAPQLSPWPETIRAQASDSLAQALYLADVLGPAAQSVAGIGRGAFVAAMHFSTLVMAVTVTVAAVVIACRTPGRGR